MRCDRSSVDALDPARRVLDLLGQRQGLRRGPHLVETVGADLVRDRAHEGRPVAVLAHLRLEPEQPPQDLVDAADVSAPSLELGPDCLLYTSPSPRDRTRYRMPSSA